MQMGFGKNMLAPLTLRTPIPYRLPRFSGVKVPTLVAPAKFDKPLPLTGGVVDGWKYQEPYPSAPCQIVTVPDGYATAQGHTLDRRGRIVHNATHKIRPSRGRNGWYVNNARLREFVCSRDIEKISGPVAPMTSSNEIMFGHWLLDIVPRYQLLVDSNMADLPIYLSTHTAFQRETIERLGHSHVIAADRHPIIQADELRVPSHQMTPGYEISAWAVRFLRDLFADEISSTDKNTRRLYLSRASVGRRDLINEQEIWGLLAPLGFEIFEPHKYSVSEQVRAFAAADTIIGPTGSAFASIVFCRPGTKIVSLDYSWVDHFVYRLSAACGLKYWYVSSRGEQPRTRTVDFEIEPADLQATLSLVGIV